MPPKIGVWASLMRKIEPLVDELMVAWLITIKCNYDCSYCGPQLHDPNGRVFTQERYRTIFDHIHRLTKHHPSVHLNLTGGEPTQIPDLIGLCRYIKTVDSGITINVNSNGSKGADYYIELASLVNSLDLSIHFEFVKHRAFMKKMAKIKRRVGNRLNVHVMAEKPHWDKFVQTTELLSRWGFNTSELRIMKETYTEDQENYLRRNSAPRLLNDMLVDGVEEDSLVFKNYLIKEHNQVRKNYFEGWKCWATSESLLVREDTLYGGVCENHVYGQIDDVTQLIEFKTCAPRLLCMCNADLRARKERK